jgi:hypothetical protein
MRPSDHYRSSYSALAAPTLSPPGPSRIDLDQPIDAESCLAIAVSQRGEKEHDAQNPPTSRSRVDPGRSRDRAALRGVGAAVEARIGGPHAPGRLGPGDFRRPKTSCGHNPTSAETQSEGCCVIGRRPQVGCVGHPRPDRGLPAARVASSWARPSPLPRLADDPGSTARAVKEICVDPD